MLGVRQEGLSLALGDRHVLDLEMVDLQPVVCCSDPSAWKTIVRIEGSTFWETIAPCASTKVASLQV